MIISTPSFVALATSSAIQPDDRYPKWARLRGVAYCGEQVTGYGAEPHYHDNDEFWFFTHGGQGEAWLDDERFDIGPNTIVYTPMGVVHRFQMFAPFGVVGVWTRPEGQSRVAHLHVPEDGLPVPTDRGLVVPGDANTGQIANRPTRCPVREMRVIGLDPERPFTVDADSVTYILAVKGGVEAKIGELSLELRAHQLPWAAPYATATTPQGDLLILRPGAAVNMSANDRADVVLIRE
jgi:mannose-6-phosphate isomerase-like protein (cupin superfamily)